jgi:hypothetical protein
MHCASVSSQSRDTPSGFGRRPSPWPGPWPGATDSRSWPRRSDGVVESEGSAVVASLHPLGVAPSRHSFAI